MRAARLEPRWRPPRCSLAKPVGPRGREEGSRESLRCAGRHGGGRSPSPSSIARDGPRVEPGIGSRHSVLPTRCASLAGASDRRSPVLLKALRCRAEGTRDRKAPSLESRHVLASRPPRELHPVRHPARPASRRGLSSDMPAMCPAGSSSRPAPPGARDSPSRRRAAALARPGTQAPRTDHPSGSPHRHRPHGPSRHRPHGPSRSRTREASPRPRRPYPSADDSGTFGPARGPAPRRDRRVPLEFEAL